MNKINKENTVLDLYQSQLNQNKTFCTRKQLLKTIYITFLYSSNIFNKDKKMLFCFTSTITCSGLAAPTVIHPEICIPYSVLRVSFSIISRQKIPVLIRQELVAS